MFFIKQVVFFIFILTGMSWLNIAQSTERMGDILLSPDKLLTEEYYTLSKKAFPGGGTSEHLKKLQEHLINFRATLPKKIRDNPDYTGQDLNHYEWFLVLLEGSALEYSLSDTGQKNLFSLSVKQRIRPDKVELNFNYPVPGSVALKIIQQENSQRWIAFSKNIPDKALVDALESIVDVPLERFRSSKLLQVTLRYVLELVLWREHQFTQLVDLHFRSTPQTVSLYEKALLRQSEVSKPLEALGSGWHQRQLRELRQKSLKLAVRRSLQNEVTGQPVINNLNTLDTLYEEYLSYVTAYEGDYAIIDDWLTANKNHQIRENKVTEAVATSNVYHTLLVHELTKKQLPPQLVAIYADEFLKSLPKGADGKWELTHNSRLISYDQYVDTFSQPAVRPQLYYDPEPRNQSFIKTLLQLVNYFYAESEPDRVSALNKQAALRSGLLLTVFAETAQQENWLAALQNLQAFAQVAAPSERQALYSHLRWFPQYWEPMTWREQGILHQGLNFYLLREFNYHKNQVTIIRYLSGTLSLPLDAHQNVSDTPGQPSTSEAQVIYQLIQQQLDDNIDQDNGVGKIYEAVFHTVFKGKYILSDKEKSLNAAGVTLPQDDSHETDKFLKLVFFTGNQDNKQISLSNIRGLALFNPVSGDTTSASLIKEAFTTLANRYDFVTAAATESALQVRTLKAIEKLRSQEEQAQALAQLNRFLYSQPYYPKELDLLHQPLRVTWQNDFGGQRLYEGSIRTLIQLALAQSELQEALSKHRSAGFIFEPEVHTGSWLKKTNTINTLIAARQHYVTSEALYRALLDQKRLASVPQALFGAESLLQLAKLIPEESESNPGDLTSTPLSHIKITHPLPLESIIAHQAEPSAKQTNTPVLTKGIIRGLENTRNRLDRLDLAQDAFGYNGVLQMVAGVEELFQQLEFFAGTIEQSDIKSAVTAIKNSLNLQQRRFASESRHQQVYAKAFELGAVDLELANAELAVERAKLLSNAREADLLAYHFDTEAHRQRAEGSQAKASAALLDANLENYEAFVIEAQIQILMSALPAYTFELQTAENLLGDTRGMIQGFKIQLTNMREDYLNNKNDRDVGSFLKAITIQVVDAVSVAYGLPPLGSIVDTTFEGVQAASDGNWSAAVDKLRDAASLSGADEFIKAEAKEVLGDVLDSESMEWARDIHKDLTESKVLQKIRATAEESGLSEYAAAEGLSFLNNIGKGVLPDDMIDRIIPPDTFRWTEDIDIKKNAKDMVAFAAAKHGKTLAGQLAKSGLKESLSLVDDDEKLKKFIKKRLKLDLDDEKQPGVKNKIETAAKNIRDDTSSALKELIKQRKLDNNQQFAVFKVQTETYLKKLVEEENVEIDDPAFTTLIKQLREKDFEGEDSGESAKDSWKEFLEKDLVTFAKSKAYATKVKTVFEEKIKSKSLRELKDNGIIQTGEDFFAGLGDAIVTGQFDLEINKNESVETKEAMEERFKQLAQFNKETREMLIGIKSSLDLSVAVHSAKFIPNTKGRMIKVLDGWEDELNELLENSQDQALSEDVQAYYEMVKERYQQVDLYKELSPQQMQILMNPPEVKLPIEIQEEIKSIDNSLAEARHAVKKITGSQKDISEQLHKIYKINDQSSFDTQMKALFDPFDEYLNELVKKISEARNTAGSASSDLNAWLQDGNNEKMIKLKEKIFKYYETKGELKLEKEELETKEEDLKENEETLKNPTINNYLRKAIEKQNAELEKEIETAEKERASKLTEIDDLKNKEIPEARKEAITAYVDEIAAASAASEFRLEEVHKQLLLSTFNSQQHQLFEVPELTDEELSEATKVITHSLLTVQGNEEATGLYRLAKFKNIENWRENVEAMRAGLLQIAESHQAVAASMQASASNARTEAAKRRLEMSKLTIGITERAKAILAKQREALVREVKAAEYDFLAADTEYSLAKLDSWELNATGDNLPILSPARLELVSRAVSRAFRDIAFITYFYEGNDIRDDFNEALSGEAFTVFNQQGIWKPSAILNMIERIKVVRTLEQKRTSQEQIVHNGRGLGILTLTRQDLLNYGIVKETTRDGTEAEKNERLLSLYIELQPADDDKCIREHINPKPYWIQNERYIGFDYLTQSRQSIKTCFDEGATGNRSRYVSAYWLNPEDADASNSYNMYLRHMGDGYITIKGQGSTKSSIPIHWKANPLRSEIDWDSITVSNGDTEKTVRLRRERTESNVEGSGQMINFDYFAKLQDPGDGLPLEYPSLLNILHEEINRFYNKELISRSAFYLYPLAGTYELLIDLPTGIEGIPEDFKIQVLFTGSATGAGS
ncbi:MAG: hypothetical protein R3F02_02760 [Thiolinea sp.]